MLGGWGERGHSEEYPLPGGLGHARPSSVTWPSPSRAVTKSSHPLEIPGGRRKAEAVS